MFSVVTEDNVADCVAGVTLAASVDLCRRCILLYTTSMSGACVAPLKCLCGPAGPWESGQCEGVESSIAGAVIHDESPSVD
jgi:hypothetical protein